MIITLADHRGKHCKHDWKETFGKDGIRPHRCAHCGVLRTPRWRGADPDEPCHPQYFEEGLKPIAQGTA